MTTSYSAARDASEANGKTVGIEFVRSYVEDGKLIQEFRYIDGPNQGQIVKTVTTSDPSDKES